MKRRILPLIAFLVFPFLSFNQIGAVAPDFTVTDIDGNSHNLYSILNSHRIAIVDVSATWCGPCWGMHSEHFLRDLNATYGPDGTDQIRIIFYEGDANTTLADLQGTTASTQGDWLTGTTYPVVNEAPLSLDLNVYAPLGFPTMNVIHPFDKKIKHDLFDSWGNDPAASLQAMEDLLDVIIAEVEAATASVNENSKVSSFAVFPNPVTNILNLYTADNSITKAVIYDELGKEIKSFENEHFSEKISTEFLEKGVYFISLFANDSKIGTKKFIKN